MAKKNKELEYDFYDEDAPVRPETLKGLPSKQNYTPQEVATYFSITLPTVYAWIRAGKLTAVKIAGTVIRIPKESILSVQMFTTHHVE